MGKLAAALLAICLSFAVAAGFAAAEAGPEYRLGFKLLAEEIPAVVGQPIEEEQRGANGDSLQRTTTGLMVWRKADNWTAFTNGSHTWINGPVGMQERRNEERFDWEAVSPPSLVSTVTTAVPAPSATPTGATAQPTSGPDIAATVQAAVATAVAEVGPRPASTPTAQGSVAEIKAHLKSTITEFGNSWGGDMPRIIANGPFAGYGSGSRYAVQQYLKALIQLARRDDTLAMYLLYVAPALDVSPNVHKALLEDRFIDAFATKVADTGTPPVQVLSVLTEREIQLHDMAVRVGNPTCSTVIYANLR